MKNFKFYIAILFALVLTFAIVGCTPDNETPVSATESYVALDINPSIELTVDEDDVITYVNALNEDGDALLLELNLVGMDLEDAMVAIIDKATELGFIDPEAEETLVQVTTAGDDEEDTNNLQERVENKINETFRNRGMYGFALKKQMTQEMIDEANTLGIAPGLLRLIKSVQEINPDLTMDDALNMSVKDLNGMLKEKGNQIKEMVRTQKEEFFAERDRIRASYQEDLDALRAQIQSLNGQIEAATDEEKPALEAQLAQVQAQLAEKIQLMEQEITQARNEYLENCAQLQEQLQTRVQTRKQEHQQALQQFQNRFNQDKENKKQAVEQWQNQKKQNQGSNGGNGNGGN